MPKSILLILAVGLTLSLQAPAVRPATWQSIGPDGGTVEALAFAPSDSRVAYAGTFSGGVFRSGDGGSSWTAVNSGLGNLFINSLAVDPRDSRIVYAGTQNGLYQTTSGGASWRLLPLRLFDNSLPPVTVVRIDPARPRILYAATEFGVFRTADGGAHWAERDAGLAGTVTAMELDPDHPGTLYAGVFDVRAPETMPRVYKTTDGGSRWIILPGLRASYIYAIARQRPTDTWYVSTFEGLFATRDGGATWTQPYQGNELETIAVSSTGTLWGAFVFSGVLSSTDGGKTWKDPALSSPDRPYSQIFSIALDSLGNRLLAGANFTGIYALDIRTGWTRASRGLRGTEITSLAITSVSPASPLLVVSTLGEGVFASNNGGASFSARNSGILPPDYPPGEIGTFGLVADPQVPGSLAVGLLVGVAQTSNAGRRWVFEPSPVCLFPNTFALASPATLFVSTVDVFYGNRCNQPVDCTAKVSRDGGASFACLNGPRDVSAFLIDPLQPSIMYAAAGDAIWKSTDRGERFTLVASNLGMLITTLATSRSAHETLYAGGDQGVLKSVDGGTTWIPAGPGRGRTTALVVDPSSSSLVYASGVTFTQALYSEAVYVSRDGGGSWILLGDGFPATNSVEALALDPVRHVLYAGTQGSGLWALTLP